MNSKVKQAQKEGFTVEDISAGLAYSVVKNTLYKVIKLRNPEDLGNHIVVQGGTFYNEAVLRSFEMLSQREVIRPNISGLMGAFGAAILAKERFVKGHKTTLSKLDEIENLEIKSSTVRCGKCSNNCLLTVNRFGNNKKFLSGNRCDEPLATSNKNEDLPNLYQYKYDRLFSYKPLDISEAKRGVIGIPRVLNMYENYPFWFTVFTELGFRVELSSESSKKIYEKGLDSIVSETACYPAKMVHGHVEDLIERGIKNIFYPCIIHEVKEQEEAGLDSIVSETACYPAKMVHGHVEDLIERGIKNIFYPCIIHEVKEQEEAENCFNCPVVTSYAEVIRNNMETISEKNINFMSPFLPLRDKKKLKKRLLNELSKFNITKSEISKSIDKANLEQERFKEDIRAKGAQTLRYISENNIKGILLGGRPYHIDPEINHGIPKLINSLGMAVFTEDSLAYLGNVVRPMNVVDQWAYHSRLYASSSYITKRDDIELVQLTSFGCGLDSITIDQVQEILDRNSKIYTNIKIDEGSNLGAARIRLRSLKAAIDERDLNNIVREVKPIPKAKPFKNPGKNGTLLVPEFSPTHFEVSENNIKGILLGGRPYHIDPEINHGIPKLINSLGMAVFTEDSLAYLGNVVRPMNVVDQWAYHSRLYASSSYITKRDDIELVQLTSFGCGLDSITIDQVQEILDRNSKIYTNIKIDEGSNLGAARIRLRSLKAAIDERDLNNIVREVKPIPKAKPFKNPGKNGTLLVPEFSPTHFEVIHAMLNQNGYNVVLLKNSENAVDEGLKYLNNDICYPAVVVIGQLIDALKSGEYDLSNTSILLAQTEGQCRFTNYVKLLEKGLKDAGIEDIPVLSLSLAGVKKENGLHGLNFEILKNAVIGMIYGDLLNKVLYRVRPYEKVKGSANKLYEKWLKICQESLILKNAVIGMIYGDLLNKVLYRVRPYEKVKGSANKLYEKWLKICQESFKEMNKDVFRKVITYMIEDFENLPMADIEKPKVGIVGESLVKLSPIANNNIVGMLEDEGVEVVSNDLLSMFLAPAYNNIYNYKNLEGTLAGSVKGKVTIKFIEKYQKIYIDALKNSKLFYTSETIEETANNASKIVSLGKQSGEGWKLAGEIMELVHWNVKNIVCMQPFGCLPAHANTRGAIKALKKHCNGLNIVPIEYDPGSSEVNQVNRIKLMLASAFNRI